MAQSKATKLIFCLRPSSAFHLLHRFPCHGKFPTSRAVVSCTRHLWTSNRACAGLHLIVGPGSDFLTCDATSSSPSPCLTCLRNHRGRYSTSFDKTKSRQKAPLLDVTSVGARKSRPRVRTFLTLGFAAVIVTVGGYFLYHSKERKSPVKARKPEPVRVTLAPQKSIIGGPFKLINHKGEVVTDQDLVGKWTLFYFGYTSCPDDCPEELQKLAEAVQKIENGTDKEIVPVFFTLDPERDSIAQIQAYIQEFHPRLIGLTGSVDDIRQVAREYRVYFKKFEDEGSDYLVDHSNFIYLLDPTMEFVKFFGREYSADSLAAEVIEEMNRKDNLDFLSASQRPR